MRWIVVGAAGMLGTDLVNLLQERGQEVRGLDLPDIDITSADSLAAQLTSADTVVNCAAFTAVDAAEEAEDKAFLLNAVGPQLLARRCKEIGARLVHISTDYVFSGQANAPYAEDGALAPLGAYGRTKAAGEWALQASGVDYLLVRTAWLYGAHGNCFPKTMARLSGEHDSLQVVADQVGQPTWTRDLADLIIRLVQAGVPAGIYHGTSAGQCSWFEFTKEIVQAVGKDPAMVNPTDSATFVRPAPRPAYSVLGHEKFLPSGAAGQLGVAGIGPWSERWAVAAGEVLG